MESEDITVGEATDTWSSVRRPPGIPSDWMPHCSLPDGGRRCLRILRPTGDELDRLKCKHHSALWFPDDERIVWKPPRHPGQSRPPEMARSADAEMAIRLSVSHDLFTAVDRTCHELNLSRMILIRDALASDPRIGYHLDKLLAVNRKIPEQEAEEQAVATQKARIAAREIAVELDKEFDAIPVEDLNLSPLPHECLKAAGLHTIGAVNALSVKRLLALPGLTAGAFGEIHTAISARSRRRRETQDQIAERAEKVVDAVSGQVARSQMDIEEIILLRDLRGLTWQQIGVRIGASPDTVTNLYWKTKNISLLSAPVQDLDLRLVTCRKLQREGIDTINQLLDRSDELSSFVGVGKGMINEIQRKLYDWGQLLAQEERVPPKLLVRIRSEEERALMHMHDVDGLPFNEISARLGVTARALRQRYHTAKNRRDS